MRYFISVIRSFQTFFSNESNFQHWKIGYYSYIILTFIEYLIFQNKIAIEGKELFFYSHLFSAIILPWIIFMIWYIIPAIYGQISIFWVDVVYCILATIISILLVSFIEINLNKTHFDLSFKIIIWFLNIILIIEFTIFSFKKPWVDVFADPYL
ncbi:MAG: hypothetical protein ACTSWX_16550 [Promethearchaeota archaeon]